ncbi:hypothetical protein QFC19_002604 [Naganishia cerealis]|uniref:Uncharacterized protein n=1 Tax=Naganishia cerealis TaxID=610337 RepID=A0ACC2WC16_9TREE|nr:hypothetical protein QFC19_002604 [Naganishia cerealis]
MTTTADSPLLPRPLEAEHHELPVHNGFLAGMHSHLPHPHGTPQTVTTKSISDQTAQYVEALKREAFGKHPEQNPGEKDVRDSEPQMGDRDVVTQVLDNSDSVRVAGGTGKYFQSNDDTLSTSEQRRTAGASSGTHGSDMNGTGSRTDGLKGIPSQVDDAQLFDGFGSTAQNAVSHPDSNVTAQINPFHKLSFPDGGSPPWITKPLVPIEGGLQSDLSSAPLVHIKRVSRDTVVLVPATPAIEQTSDLASTLQAGQTSTHFLQKNGNSQQLEMTNGQLAIMTRQEERKTGFFSRFERAFGRSGNDQHTSDIPLPDGGIQVRSSQLPDSGDFLRQGPLGDDSTEVQGNAPPSPPISDHDTGVENNNAASSVQTRPFHAFQPLGDMRVISPLAEPFYGNVEAHGQYGNGGLPPLPKSTSLSVVSIVDGTSSQRSISGQSYTAEPETMNDVEETQQDAIAASRARLRPSVNTTMLEGVNSRNSVASASGSPTDSAATPADKTVVLAPPILTGTTRSGSIAAIKRGLGKASNATGSRQTSTAGSSLIDMESRVPSPVSLQAVGRRMSSDRYSQKGRQSLEQYAQNGLGLGIPANPAQGPVNSTAPPPASQSPPLQPPINPGRRNTTSGFSSPKAPNRNPLISSQSQLQIPQSSNTSSGFTGGLLSPKSRQMTDVPGLNGPALDPDILAEADRLRKERLNRRQRRRSGSGDEAIPLDGESPPGVIPSTSEEINGDAISARSQSQTKYKERQLPTEQDRVLVGNLIGEDHVNYVLMYNMLTGIRIGVRLYSSVLT